MNSLRTILHFSRAQNTCWTNAGQLRSICSLFLSRVGTEQKTLLTSKTETPLLNHQPVRTVKRGTEYQPKNIKRKRTHGWIKRISTPGGIEVILRRMLKGRKSLTH